MCSFFDRFSYPDPFDSLSRKKKTIHVLHHATWVVTIVVLFVVYIVKDTQTPHNTSDIVLMEQLPTLSLLFTCYSCQIESISVTDSNIIFYEDGRDLRLTSTQYFSTLGVQFDPESGTLDLPLYLSPYDIHDGLVAEASIYGCLSKQPEYVTDMSLSFYVGDSSDSDSAGGESPLIPTYGQSVLSVGLLQSSVRETDGSDSPTWHINPVGFDAYQSYPIGETDLCTYTFINDVSIIIDDLDIARLTLETRQQLASRIFTDVGSLLSIAGTLNMFLFGVLITRCVFARLSRSAYFDYRTREAVLHITRDNAERELDVRVSS